MVEMAWVSKQSPAKMFKQRVVAFKKFHPTTKPLNLMEWCLCYFPDAQSVIDPFMGSGTTAIAAYKEHKQFIGFEKEKEYCDIAEARLKPYITQKKLI
jgi:site-specific DNA-methyltransferase (adenine-specific)/modification methylase